MRLFVAVVPPDDVLDELESVLEPRRDSAAGTELRWTDRHQWHVTLAFLGDVAERRLDDLTEALAASVARRRPVTARLRGAGTFPNPYAARVLWAGVEQVRGDLAEVAHGIRSSASSVGASPDGAPFEPHLTLARFGRPTEATRWIRALSGLETTEWTVADVALVESHLGQGRGRRPRHETLAELPLGG
jgi:2'-5' RNA ligase